ncbi:hypothetical protein [Flaviaesturariibacter terrae]
MDLNHIQLSGAQLAELYPNSLVELASPGTAAGHGPPAPAAPKSAPAAAPAAAAPAAAATALPSYLGQNGKGILVVTADRDAPYLGDADLAFLTNVLGACSLGMGDVAIVNWRRLEAPDGPALSAALQARQVLLFDLTPADFGLPANFPPFQVQALAGRTYLHAPALGPIAADKELKKALWLALKKMFGV